MRLLIGEEISCESRSWRLTKSEILYTDTRRSLDGAPSEQLVFVFQTLFSISQYSFLIVSSIWPSTLHGIAHNSIADARFGRYLADVTNSILWLLIQAFALHGRVAPALDTDTRQEGQTHGVSDWVQPMKDDSSFSLLIVKRGLGTARGFLFHFPGGE